MTDQPPVAVLALNPAVDISYEVPQLLEYQKVGATQTWYHPGGNGINVARALTELSVPVRCCSAIGGESGEMLLRLLGGTIGDNHNWFRIAGETRLNTTILQQNPPGQYEVTSPGPHIPPEVLEQISECFLLAAGEGLAVLTGQIPPGVPEAFYRDLTEQIAARGGKVILDAHGPELEQALAAAPHLVRLNHYVLAMNSKRRLDTKEDVAEAARALQKRGIDYLCVSIGHQGAILTDANNSWHCNAPKVHKQSTVGCGDALVAGLIAKLREGASPEEMLRFGVVCGSATATKPGTGLFERAELEGDGVNLEVSALGI